MTVGNMTLILFSFSVGIAIIADGFFLVKYFASLLRSYVYNLFVHSALLITRWSAVRSRQTVSQAIHPTIPHTAPDYCMLKPTLISTSHGSVSLARRTNKPSAFSFDDDVFLLLVHRRIPYPNVRGTTRKKNWRPEFFSSFSFPL